MAHCEICGIKRPTRSMLLITQNAFYAVFRGKKIEGANGYCCIDCATIATDEMMMFKMDDIE